MNELFTKLLMDAAVLSAIGTGLIFVAKKIFTSTVDTLYKNQQEFLKASLDIAREREKALIVSDTAIYPEIVELVYRLRNQFRHEMDFLRRFYKNNNQYGISFGEELFLLTDRLYKYRLFLDGEIWSQLHEYKRALQDAKVLGDRLSRQRRAYRGEQGNIVTEPEEDNWEEYKSRYDESIATLESLFSNVNDLYPKITEAIQAHMRSVLSRPA